eukprot:TRINITY_DN459_c1_g1_i1.p1 TRINITY_DN459_c1_g1~~TRINITY_DN459_c1_g1_i1.p1  ORF type:complete len:723 (-),score=152.84 TRINITY_DN459_c1_g1_i1:166-2166(-)
MAEEESIPLSRGSRNSSYNLVDDTTTGLRQRHKGSDEVNENDVSGSLSRWGVKPWGFVSKKQSRPIFGVPDELDKSADEENQFRSIGNILWVVFFGWWLSVTFAISSLLLFITWVGRPYAYLCWNLTKYFFWPFGKYVVEEYSSGEDEVAIGEENLLIPGSRSVRTSSKAAYGVFVVVLCSFLLPITVLNMALNWFFVVSIPMSKVILTIIQLLVSKPNHLAITTKYQQAQAHNVHLCTYRAFNILYFDYEYKGINIVFLNLLPVVILRIALILIGFFVHIELFSPVVQFFVNLLCSIPITFYIGMSISSIAAQTNYTIGAILNATFGSITELTLFTIALNSEGGFQELILYSLTGSLLCDMLLMPGLAMIVGGIKYKEQHFNAKAAGVSSILLFIAIIGAFSPTIFYHVFGRYSQKCTNCITTFDDVTNTTQMVCSDCHYFQDNVDHDPAFDDGVRYLLWFTGALMPVAYIIGMVFTFKTHKHLFEDEEGEEGSAEWGLATSILVMLVSVLCFGLIAEDVVHVLQGVLESLGVTQAFLGITLIALTPAATEIANAIKFALLDQISLSVGIGSASAIQVSLIQMPALIWISMITNANSGDATPFHLVFPVLSVFAVILAVMTFNYISSEGTTNYFIGASLVIIYLCLVSAFYFVKSSVPSPPPSHH